MYRPGTTPACRGVILMEFHGAAREVSGSGSGAGRVIWSGREGQPTYKTTPLVPLVFHGNKSEVLPVKTRGRRLKRSL